MAVFECMRLIRVKIITLIESGLGNSINQRESHALALLSKSEKKLSISLFTCRFWLKQIKTFNLDVRDIRCSRQNLLFYRSTNCLY